MGMRQGHPLRPPCHRTRTNCAPAVLLQRSDDAAQHVEAASSVRVREGTCGGSSCSVNTISRLVGTVMSLMPSQSAKPSQIRTSRAHRKRPQYQTTQHHAPAVPVQSAYSVERARPQAGMRQVRCPPTTLGHSVARCRCGTLGTAALGLPHGWQRRQPRLKALDPLHLGSAEWLPGVERPRGVWAI